MGRIDGDGQFKGTGFFVAPGEVLTCAHVVHGSAELVVGWDGGSSPATVTVALPDLAVDDPAARFFPLLDVALLRLDNPSDHPCVALDRSEPVTGPPPDVLRLDALTVGEHAANVAVRSAASTDYEGQLEEEGWWLLKLKGGQVLAGFSGSPLLNTRTGGVPASFVVVRSRGGGRRDG